MRLASPGLGPHDWFSPFRGSHRQNSFALLDWYDPFGWTDMEEAEFLEIFEYLLSNRVLRAHRQKTISAIEDAFVFWRQLGVLATIWRLRNIVEAVREASLPAA